jgi:translation initiation factor 4E
LKIKKKANVLGKMWQDLNFALIGEAFETLNVVGIAMAIRSKEDMISVRRLSLIKHLCCWL